MIRIGAHEMTGGRLTVALALAAALSFAVALGVTSRAGRKGR